MGVSWGRAFRGALMITIYSIVWIIIGVVVIVASVGTTILGNLASFQSGQFGAPQFNPYTSVGSSALGAVGVIVGVLIIMLGVTASYLKVQSDVVAEEVEKRLKPAASQ